jgi:hypothetical protein
MNVPSLPITMMTWVGKHLDQTHRPEQRSHIYKVIRQSPSSPFARVTVIMHTSLISFALAAGFASALPQGGAGGSGGGDPSQVIGQLGQPQCLAAIGNIFSNSSYPQLSQCLGDQQLGDIGKAIGIRTFGGWSSVI